jgi:hypothetical protein
VILLIRFKQKNRVAAILLNKLSLFRYGNGPGYFNYNNESVEGRAGWLDPESNNGTRRNITDDDFKNPNYVVAAAVPFGEFGETHGGDDVRIFMWHYSYAVNMMTFMFKNMI